MVPIRRMLLACVGTLTLTWLGVAAVAPAPDARSPRLSVTTFPTCIAADGTGTLRVEATVRAGDGTAAPDGTRVTFSSSAGTLLSETQATRNGMAVVLLRCTPTPGKAVVTVAAGDARAEATAWFGERPAAVAVERTIQFVPADGRSWSAIIAHAGGMKAYVPDGTPVSFSTDLGEIVPQSTTTGGYVVALLTSTKPGVATVTAQCGEVRDSATVEFVPATYRLGLGADAWYFSANRQNDVRLTARLYDENDRPLYLDRVPVEFEASRGQLSTSEGQTRLGAATAVLRVAAGPPGDVTVTARTTRGEAPLTLHFAGRPTQMTLGRNLPDRGSPDGALLARVVATVRDKDRQPVPGAEVAFYTDRGTIGRTAKTDSGGKAIAELRFPARVGEAVIGATCDDLRVSRSMRFSGAEGEVVELEPPRQPSKVTVTCCNQTLDGERISQDLLAVVEDAHGTRLSGCVVHFNATAGEITQRSETDRNGVASAALSLPLTAREALVAATTGDVRTSLTVSVPALSSAKCLSAKALPGVVKADGRSYSLLRVYLWDSEGEWIPLPNASGLRIEGPEDATLWCWSPSGPWASYYLGAVRSPGRARVAASYAGLSLATEVTFSEDPSSVLVESHCPEGGGQVYIRATVRDRNGLPVPDGTPLAFTQGEDGRTVGSTTTRDGFAVVMLPTPVDPTEVSAACGTAIGRLTLAEH
ncbi:MAG: hypothetical protein GW911_29750 [Armatimonadetes bacterium]|nr:hypothetical protein [Armatimonadota bacterium]NCO94985.1 hypothetical protein [Armatimonadota bacterium]NCP31013.1 hypothetical protein [Armatimonadota bacterium]NCQ25861.1 hypothetical protein [Armatimonadota bacterium]NDK16232.1 hypothetical protein [Armatimonadota bacterium]